MGGGGDFTLHVILHNTHMHSIPRLLDLSTAPLNLSAQVLVVHGGLFQRDGVTLDELAKIDRFREPPDEVSGAWGRQK